MIEESLKEIFNEIKNGNNKGEKITLVGATKFVNVDKINKAISCGLENIGENKAQEFRDKFPLVLPCNYHFFGTLQKNKVKYLIGKVYLIHSVDSLELIEEISKQSLQKNVVTNILLELNLGEEQKGGFDICDVENILKLSSNYSGVCIKGFMAMLPNLQDENTLIPLLEKVRNLYDDFKEIYNFENLSIGMSNDYKLAIKHGSNMIRVGSKIFGERYWV